MGIMSRQKLQLLVSLFLFLMLVGCAAREFLAKGDQLLQEGRHVEAINQYEKALVASPGNPKAEEGIRKARRLAVRIALRKAKKRLSRGQYARALSGALKARRMPLDLEDVDLVQQIDATIGAAAKAAEKRVREFVGRKHFISAVELANGVVYASPGERSREIWARDIRDQAIKYYTDRGTALSGSNPGSAAVQFALAKRAAGAKMDVAEIAPLWESFAAPVCFSDPQVQIKAPENKLSAEVEAGLNRRLNGALKSFQQRCGVGTRPLALTLTFDEITILDSTHKEMAAKPLPGVRLKTEEVYFEEVPYTAIEEVTEYEIRIEKKEMRDCAPRPGKPRGCRTWIEDVKVKVPVITKKEVRKVRKVERRRPVKDLPKDKIIEYEVTTVSRRIAYSGKIEIQGAGFEAPAFMVVAESIDSANEETRSKGAVVKADALEVDSMASVEKSAANKLFKSIRRALGRAVRDWTREMRTNARQKSVEGNAAAAEEGYLGLVALGVKPDKELQNFFMNRYGLSLKDVLGTVSRAVGRNIVASAKPTRGEKNKKGFPKRGIPKRIPSKAKRAAIPMPAGKSTADATADAVKAAGVKIPVAIAEVEEDIVGVAAEEFEGSDEELDDFSDLIEASLDEGESKEEDGESKDGEKKDGEKKKDAKEDEKGKAKAPDEAPKDGESTESTESTESPKPE